MVLLATIALWPQFRNGSRAADVATPRASAAHLVAEVAERPFRMPSVVFDHWKEDCQRPLQMADSTLAVAPLVSAGVPNLSLTLEEECEGNRIAVRYFLDLDRFISVTLRNVGNGTARNVSVRLPLRFGDWRREGSEATTVPHQVVSGLGTLDVGDLRPGETVRIRSWAGSIGNDTVAVFQEAGAVEIRRQQ
jgi:hypothetical protein